MKWQISVVLLLALSLSACGPMKLSGATPTDTTYAVDGVKLISSSISRGDDARTYGQRRYTISSEARVLLRFESLTTSQSKILKTQPIWIRVFTPDAAGQTTAVANLKACPVLEDWMMAASWKSAHPYRGGEWKDGAPIEDDECTPATAIASTTGDCAATNAVCFDVSSWYKHYVVERGLNFGHALTSETPVEILGDGSHSKGPRIQWSE
ncbi:MAG: hypothetical protein AAB250_17570 [Bdellovibrionota bacterium]